MRPAPRRFLSVCVALDAPRIKSKSQEVESIVSHPLKFAEGGAASVGLMEGWASPPHPLRFSEGGSHISECWNRRLARGHARYRHAGGLCHICEVAVRSIRLPGPLQSLRSEAQAVLTENLGTDGTYPIFVRSGAARFLTP